jgi:rubrerythrin
MLSKIPIDLNSVRKEDIDKEILRIAIIAEFDAINLYEQIAAMTTSPNIKTVLFDVAREEKEHVGEFQTLLLREDCEQVEELKEGNREVERLTGSQD